MAEATYQELYAGLLADGFGAAAEVLPKGEYTVKIANVKPGASQGGKFQVGVRLVVEDEGPHKGKATWINQTLTLTPEALAPFLRFHLSLGVPQEAITRNEAPETLYKYIAVGTVGKAELKTREFNGKSYQDLVRFSRIDPGSVPAASAPAAPAPTPVSVEIPVSAPVAVPVAAEAPAPARVLPVQAAPAQTQVPDGSPSVEELQRLLAAAQAQQPTPTTTSPVPF